MKKAIFFMASYAAPYEGNFIPSLRELGKLINSRDIACLLAIPAEAKQFGWPKQQTWCEKVYYMSGTFSGDLEVFSQAFSEYDTILIYTHFSISWQIAALILFSN